MQWALKDEDGSEGCTPLVKKQDVKMSDVLNRAEVAALGSALKSDNI